MTQIRDKELSPFIIDFDGDEYIVYEEFTDNEGNKRDVNKKRFETLNSLFTYLARQLVTREEQVFTSTEEFTNALSRKADFVKEKLGLIF